MTNAGSDPGISPQRHLPGHIAAALAGAGGTGDSAGQPWAGRSLAGDDAKIHNFENDDGTADAGYVAAVRALQAGTGDEAGVVAALATARVFIPIVAQLAEEAETADGLHADKQADMAGVHQCRCPVRMAPRSAPGGRLRCPGRAVSSGRRGGTARPGSGVRRHFRGAQTCNVGFGATAPMGPFLR